MAGPKLITIPFSHYCEKARWALDRCGVAFDEDGHLPIFHYVPVRRAGGGRTVPILVDGKTRLTDSTDIMAWADARRPGSLLPADARDRDYALSLEDDFDRQLGPATRRWAYHQLMRRRDLDQLLTRGVPRWESTALRYTRPLALAMLRRGLNITPEGAARSLAKIDATFARVTTLLRDGRRFLTGNRFSVADLTFAALAAPVLIPSKHPYSLLQVEGFTGEVRAQIETWRATPAGRHGLALYDSER